MEKKTHLSIIPILKIHINKMVIYSVLILLRRGDAITGGETDMLLDSINFYVK